jgi:hypothetical protein
MSKVNIPQNLVSGITSYGTLQIATEEVKKFLRWLRKGNMKRKFNFEVIEEDYAEVLNKYVGIGDLDSARWYAERYIGL